MKVIKSLAIAIALVGIGSAVLGLFIGSLAFLDAMSDVYGFGTVMLIVLLAITLSSVAMVTLNSLRREEREAQKKLEKARKDRLAEVKELRKEFTRLTGTEWLYDPDWPFPHHPKPLCNRRHEVLEPEAKEC